VDLLVEKVAGDFDSRHRAQGRLRAGRGNELGDAGDGVVVCQGYAAKLQVDSQGDQFRRRAGAVGGGTVAVQVDGPLQGRFRRLSIACHR